MEETRLTRGHRWIVEMIEWQNCDWRIAIKWHHAQKKKKGMKFNRRVFFNKKWLNESQRKLLCPHAAKSSPIMKSDWKSTSLIKIFFCSGSYLLSMFNTRCSNSPLTTIWQQTLKIQEKFHKSTEPERRLTFVCTTVKPSAETQFRVPAWHSRVFESEGSILREGRIYAFYSEKLTFDLR